MSQVLSLQFRAKFLRATFCRIVSTNAKRSCSWNLNQKTLSNRYSRMLILGCAAAGCFLCNATHWLNFSRHKVARLGKFRQSCYFLKLLAAISGLWWLTHIWATLGMLSKMVGCYGLGELWQYISAKSVDPGRVSITRVVVQSRSRMQSVSVVRLWSGSDVVLTVLLTMYSYHRWFVVIFCCLCDSPLIGHCGRLYRQGCVYFENSGA